MELTINVYDDNDNIVKESKANTVDLRMGQVSAIMELLDADNIDNSLELMNVVNKAWKQLVKILSKVFPDMTDADWEYVKVGELIPTLVLILKESFAKMMTIPKSKNA